MKRPRLTAAEQDAFSRYWRRYYCYLRRPGVVAGIKRQANKRERREAKTEIRQEGT
jgi:hypothetical protein